MLTETESNEFSWISINSVKPYFFFLTLQSTNMWRKDPHMSYTVSYNELFKHDWLILMSIMLCGRLYDFWIKTKLTAIMNLWMNCYVFKFRQLPFLAFENWTVYFSLYNCDIILLIVGSIIIYLHKSISGYFI